MFQVMYSAETALTISETIRFWRWLVPKLSETVKRVLSWPPFPYHDWNLHSFVFQQKILPKFWRGQWRTSNVLKKKELWRNGATIPLNTVFFHISCPHIERTSMPTFRFQVLVLYSSKFANLFLILFPAFSKWLLFIASKTCCFTDRSKFANYSKLQTYNNLEDEIFT